MNNILSNSIFFGMILSLFTYWIGFICNKKTKLTIVNPLLISTILIILFLTVFNIDFETYNNGAKYISYFLTPATICLAVPLYRQFEVLKRNIPAVLAGIICGCLTHAGIILIIGWFYGVNGILTLSLLPKSITTAIAIGVSEEIGGISAVTVVGVTIAGLSGAILGPVFLKLFHIKNPIAQGLAIGTCSHALGTSKACELGEIQAAMSSLAIVVTGILTVVIAPMIAQFL